MHRLLVLRARLNDAQSKLVEEIRTAGEARTDSIRTRSEMRNHLSTTRAVKDNLINTFSEG